MAGKILLIGESNPYGADPYYALYPAPDGCTGHRLCTLILEMSRKDYLERFDRANLCDGPWSMPKARERAEQLWCEAVNAERAAIVLLGRKVVKAFALPEMKMPPFSVETNCVGIPIVALPHPSGLCREWNKPGAFERARKALRDGGVI